MEHKFKIESLTEITHKGEGLAKKDHLISGNFSDASGKSVKVNIVITKGKTKLSEIPDGFLPTVKAEGIF